MKTFLSLAAGVACMLPLSQANAAVFTLGGPNSKLCYEAASVLDDRGSMVEGCTLALQQDPLSRKDRAATHVNRGILLMVTGRQNEADADFREAIELDSSLSDAWLNRGFLKLRQNRGAEALNLIDEGLRQSPRRQALALFARGLAHEQMGNLRAAYRDLRAARDLEPQWGLPGQFLARYEVRN